MGKLQIVVQAWVRADIFSEIGGEFTEVVMFTDFIGEFSDYCRDFTRDSYSEGLFSHKTHSNAMGVLDIEYKSNSSESNLHLETDHYNCIKIGGL